MLNNTDINISPLTLGTWSFGGDFWNGGSDQDCIDAIRCALDSGINCIDTAPIYSAGRSEELVGQGIHGRREQVILATKCGLTVKGSEILKDLSARAIFAEVEASLRRLNTDYIDLYQCHWPDDDVSAEETFTALNKLRTQGKIRYIGLSNYSVNQFKEALTFSDIVSSQDQYSMLVRDVEDGLSEFLVEQDIGMLAYGSLAGGILTGKYKRPPEFSSADARGIFYKFYDGDSFNQTQSFLDQLKELNHPLSELTINWVRAQNCVASVIVGCRNPAQVKANVSALSWSLKSDEISRIRSILPS